MSDEAKILAESHSMEAINATKNAQEAIEKARIAQLGAVMEVHKEAFFEQYTNIMTTLAILVTGQKNMDDHLAILNGKVAEHQKELTMLTLWKAELKGFSSAINLGWTTLITLFSGTAGAIIFWLYHK